MKLFEIFGKVKIDDSEALKQLDNLDKKGKETSSKFGKSMKALGGFATKAAIGIGAAFAATSVKAIQLGSDAEEMQNKFNVTFKTLGKDAENWAKTYSKSVGRSVNDTKKFLSNIADLQQGLGMSEESSLDLSQKIIELGTDLASFNNINDADAIEAVQKAMLGEAESAKQLGLLLNVDRVKEFAEAQGKVFEELTDAERAMLTYELAVSQSQNAIGDAERSSGSFANQMKAFKSTLKDMTTEFGKKLLPVATKFLTWLNNSLPKMVEFKNALVDSFLVTFGPVIDAVKMFADVVATSFETVRQAVVDGLSLEETFYSLQESLLESDNGFAVFVGNILGYFGTITGYFQEELLPIIQEVFGVVKSVIFDAFESSRGIFDAVIANFGVGLTSLKGIFATVFEEMTRRATILATFFKETLMPAFKVVIDFVIAQFPVWQAMFTKVFKVLVDVSMTLFKFFQDNLLPIIKSLVNWFIDNLPFFEEVARKVFSAVITVIEKMWLLIKDHVMPIIEALLEVAKKVFPVIWDVIKIAIEAIMKALKSLWDVFDALILPIIQKLFDVISWIIPKLAPIFETVFKAIGGVLGVFGDVLSGVIDFVKGFAKVFGDIFQGIGDVIAGIWGGITDVIKGAINFIISGINTFIKGVNKVKVPDWVPGVGGKGINISTIPMLAEGGNIIQSGKILVGENGPEIFEASAGARVTPLKDGQGAEIGGNTVTNEFNISQLVVREEADIQKIARELHNMSTERKRGLAY